MNINIYEVKKYNTYNSCWVNISSGMNKHVSNYLRLVAFGQTFWSPLTEQLHDRPDNFHLKN